jgi:tryptophan synthase alpha chain
LRDRPISARWQAVRAERRAALIPFFTAGFPNRAVCLAALRAAVAAGADLVEIGIPFSDPLADGPTIQRASQAALVAGITPAGVLALVREAALPVPVVLMTYANPVLAYGPARFARDAADAGAAAVLLTDVPAGADAALEGAITSSPLDLIRLVAPTTTDARLAAAVQGGGGFVYLISRTGVTGARADAPPDLERQVSRLRHASPLPIAVGFGISTPEHVRAAAAVADGVVVGSALVTALEREGPEGAAALIRALAAATRRNGNATR